MGRKSKKKVTKQVIQPVEEEKKEYSVDKVRLFGIKVDENKHYGNDADSLRFLVAQIIFVTDRGPDLTPKQKAFQMSKMLILLANECFCFGGHFRRSKDTIILPKMDDWNLCDNEGLEEFWTHLNTHDQSIKDDTEFEKFNDEGGKCIALTAMAYEAIKTALERLYTDDPRKYLVPITRFIFCVYNGYDIIYKKSGDNAIFDLKKA